MRLSILKFISFILVVILAIGGLAVSAQEGDTLTLLYWQAPSTMNGYLSGGTKEIEAFSLTNEPLARFDPDGVLVPYLATEIPTLENGDFSEDLTTLTWHLRDDIVWSDGTPFTAADVVFTWEYCTSGFGCSYESNFANVAGVEAADDYTVVITFDAPKPNPYNAFVSYTSPIIQKAQFESCMGADAPNCTEQNFAPIGTGPFVVEEFRPNDVITFTANPNYRVEGEPHFDRLILKGGGDAEGAARAVLETGEADYAWNLQISPSILDSMEANGVGTVVVGFATNLERLQINQTNPSSELGDDVRSIYGDGNNPHPFLSNITIRQALSMAIDRTIISEQLYGKAGRPACNVLNNPPAFVSPNNEDCLNQDIAGANALLDEAGIVDANGDGVRELDGVPLRILYQTSTNAVRQSTQALIKQWWSEIGVETELRNIDSSVFFGGDPASPDTYQKFYADVEMFTSGTTGTDPESFFIRWICDDMPGPDNGWLGRNVPRHCNPEYDAAFTTLTQTAGVENRAAVSIQLNDLIIDSYVLIPLVHRGSASAHSNTISGVHIDPWDSELWNIATWTRVN